MEKSPSFKTPQVTPLKKKKKILSICNNECVIQGPCLGFCRFLDRLRSPWTPALNPQPISCLYSLGSTLGPFGNLKHCQPRGHLFRLPLLVPWKQTHTYSSATPSSSDLISYSSLVHSPRTATPVYTEVSEGTTIFTYMTKLKLFVFREASVVAMAS